MELRYTKLDDGYQDAEFVEVLEVMRADGLTQRMALALATPVTLVRALQQLKSMPSKQLAASYAAAKAIRDLNQR